MDQLVNLYDLHQLKQGKNKLAAKDKKLKCLTRKINNIFYHC